MAKKTKWGMGVASSALALSLIAGGTYAVFTSKVSNANNEFVAGTVSIADDTGQTIASKMSFSNLAPGDSETRQLQIRNSGNLDAWVKVNDGLTHDSKSGPLFQGNTPLEISYSKNYIHIPKGETRSIDVTYRLPLYAGDSYQGAKGWVNIVVSAEQFRNNDKVAVSDVYAPKLTGSATSQIVVDFKLNEAVTLPNDNVEIIYQVKDGDGNWQSVYAKNNAWSGYLNIGTQKYGTGILGVTPDYNSTYAAVIPADQVISTAINPGKAVGAKVYEALVGKNFSSDFRALITVTKASGAQTVTEAYPE